MSGLTAFTLMGVVNVTPDSFSDGGRYFESNAAIAHGLELELEGAAILDIGGESTRPGADPVGAEEELRRVLPVIDGLVAAGCKARISVDTSKSEVAAEALAAGASYVNDVTAFRGDPELADVVASSGADCCLMHMLGDPRTMQDDPRYDDVVSEVREFLEERVAFALARGIERDRIMLDPGIGFGKTLDHNLELLRRLDELVAHRTAAGDRHLAQVVFGPDHRPRARRAGRRHRRHQRARLRTRGPRVPRTRRGSGPRRPRGDGCYGHRPMADADDFDDDDVDDEDEGHPEPEVTIEISGLSLFTHVGVTAAEREVGQRLLLDLRIDVGDTDATVTDRVEDTVDYAQVCDIANLIAQRSYKTLERLCAAIADRLLEQYDVHAVWVKAAKPEPPLHLPVTEVSVEVWREAE